MVDTQTHIPRTTVVQVRECDAVLSPDLRANNDFVDVVELAQILVFFCLLPEKRLKLWTARNGQIQSFGSVKTFLVEKIKVVLINKV